MNKCSTAVTNYVSVHARINGVFVRLLVSHTVNVTLRLSYTQETLHAHPFMESNRRKYVT